MRDQVGLRIIFAGTPAFAEHHLRALLNSNHQVIAVYTQPDRPAGRGKKLSASPVKSLALQHNIPVFQPQSLKGPEAQSDMAALNADIMVVVAYGLILPQVVLNLPRLGCINVHASLLPRWRGAAPIQRAIAAGDQQTGITIMKMEAGLDTGPMISRVCCDITDDDTSATLHDRLAELGGTALIKSLELFLQGKPQLKMQDDSQATYADKIDKSEAEINWQLAAIELQRNIRAFVPFPIAYSFIEGKRVKIYKASLVSNPDPSAVPGTIVAVNFEEPGGITVACGEAALQIEQLQLPGKSVLTAHQVLMGQRDLFLVGKQFSGNGTE